jgi:hypothetical protein
VGASGAIFGLFGVLFAANRVHRPVDHQSRGIVRQIGMLVVINIVFGLTIPSIDNAAHIGGLVTGLWIGVVVAPTRVETLDSYWARFKDGPLGALARAPALAPILAVAVIAIVVVAGLMVGTAERAG